MEKTREQEIQELSETLEGWIRAGWSPKHMATDLVECGIHGMINFELFHYRRCLQCKDKK